ncbi:hypothetical protein [Rhizobium leguminosarum]
MSNVLRSIGTAFVVSLVAAGLYAGYNNSRHIEHQTIFVESKERLLRISSDKDGNSSSSYRNFVYASDETYVVEDSIFNGHFRAGTVYAQIKEKATCQVTLSGYRIGFLSLYQNIIAATCVRSAVPE